MIQLTEILQVRVTKPFLDALMAKAEGMGIRYQDFVRVRLAESVFGENDKLIDPPTMYHVAERELAPTPQQEPAQ